MKKKMILTIKEIGEARVDFLEEHPEEVKYITGIINKEE
jgi:hypothetical protein